MWIKWKQQLINLNQVREIVMVDGEKDWSIQFKFGLPADGIDKKMLIFKTVGARYAAMRVIEEFISDCYREMNVLDLTFFAEM